MELDINRIVRIKRIRIEKSELSKEETNLITPTLTNKDLVKEIYRVFREIQDELTCPPNPESVYQKKKFVFIILFLYSPDALAGSRMVPGLREELAKAMGMREVSTVSNYCSDLVFLFQNYADFREEVCTIFTRLYQRLQEEGLIEQGRES